MIRRLLLLLLTLGISRGYCQMTPQDYLEKGHGEWRQGHDAEALAAFRYIVEQHPSSPLCTGAHYYMGVIFAGEKKDAEAIKEYRAVLADTLEDAPILSRKACFPFDRRHDAAYKLSELYEQTRMYDSALYFFGLSDTVFRTHVFGCGNAADGEENRRLLRYAKLEEDGKHIKDAERTLLAHKEFCLGSGEHVLITQLGELCKKYEDRKKLRSEIDNAVEHFYLDTGCNKYLNDTFVHCCINFLGAKVQYQFKGSRLIFGGCEEQPPPYADREQLIWLLKKTALYVMVKNL